MEVINRLDLAMLRVDIPEMDKVDYTGLDEAILQSVVVIASNGDILGCTLGAGLKNAKQRNSEILRVAG